MRALQRVIRRFPSSDEAGTARAWNTILYRVYLRASPGPAFTASAHTITGPGGRLRDVAALSLAPDGKLGVATRAGILVIDEKGAIARQAPSSEPRQLQFDRQNRLTIVQRAVVLRENERGMQRVALTAATSGGPRLLQDIRPVRSSRTASWSSPIATCARRIGSISRGSSWPHSGRAGSTGWR